MRQKNFFKIRLMLLLLCVSMLACGCAIGGIRQDSVVEDLPQIDPEDGVTKEMAVTLYYRLTNEDYLVGISRSISVRASERVEMAMIRTLLDGVPLQALSPNISPIFPAGTSIVEVSVAGDIMYVTLSREFLSTSAYDEIREAAELSYQNNAISKETLKSMLDIAYGEFLTTRRLAVYSLVNTIVLFNSSVRVQVLVDADGSGAGTRLKLSDLGLNADDQADSDLIEPMKFVESCIVTPQIVTQCALGHIVNSEYELAYPLFSEDDGSAIQKPQYANFETEMKSLGSLDSFKLYGSSVENDENYVRIKADLVFRSADGSEKEIKGKELLLKREGDLYRLGYGTLLSLLKG